MDKKREREQAIESAFESVMTLYEDEKEMSKTLASARRKVTALEVGLAKNRGALTRIDTHLHKTVHELTELQFVLSQVAIANRADRDDARGRANASKNLYDIMTSIENGVKTSSAYKTQESKVEESQVKLEKAKRFVKMLEGVKSVASAGGITRGRKKGPIPNIEERPVKKAKRSHSTPSATAPDDDDEFEIQD